MIAALFKKKNSEEGSSVYETPKTQKPIFLDDRLSLADFNFSATVGTGTFGRVRVVKLANKPSYIQALSTRPLHENVTNSWIIITLTEGKFHQVRKMVAAVKHKCLRLIRIAIEDIELEDLKPGEVREVSEQYFFEKLKLS
jgi:16S rRNA U516 pseudouridylate synthase RsuA-like enzyme